MKTLLKSHLHICLNLRLDILQFQMHIFGNKHQNFGGLLASHGFNFVFKFFQFQGKQFKHPFQVKYQKA